MISAKADWQNNPGSPRIGENMKEPPRTAMPEGLGTNVDEDAAVYAEECDWDEYADEIASAAAFASWQDVSARPLDWDEDEMEMAELEGEHWSVEEWGEWAAHDEIEG